jgi:hypothetical protein
MPAQHQDYGALLPRSGHDGVAYGTQVARRQDIRETLQEGRKGALGAGEPSELLRSYLALAASDWHGTKPSQLARAEF